MIPSEMDPDIETIPGDRDADDVVSDRRYDLIVLTIAIFIVFAYTSKWWM